MNEDVVPVEYLAHGTAVRVLVINGLAAIAILLIVWWLAKVVNRRAAVREKDEKFSHQ